MALKCSNKKRMLPHYVYFFALNYIQHSIGTCNYQGRFTVVPKLSKSDM
jgi:hypothetical protein